METLLTPEIKNQDDHPYKVLHKTLRNQVLNLKTEFSTVSKSSKNILEELRNLNDLCGQKNKRQWLSEGTNLSTYSQREVEACQMKIAATRKQLKQLRSMYDSAVGSARLLYSTVEEEYFGLPGKTADARRVNEMPEVDVLLAVIYGSLFVPDAFVKKLGRGGPNVQKLLFASTKLQNYKQVLTNGEAELNQLREELYRISPSHGYSALT